MFSKDVLVPDLLSPDVTVLHTEPDVSDMAATATSTAASTVPGAMAGIPDEV